MATNPLVTPVPDAPKPAIKAPVVATNINKKTGIKTTTETDASTGAQTITTTDATGKATVETVTLPERVAALETKHESLLAKLRKKLAFFDR